MKTVWLRISKAAKEMGMSRLGATKRLKKLEKAHGVTLLRRTEVGAPWEVNMVNLRRIEQGGDEIDRTIEGLQSKVAFLSTKVEAYRRISKKKHEAHEKKLLEVEKQLNLDLGKRG